MQTDSKRINWGRQYNNIPKLDLIAVQLQSWKKFLAHDLEELIQSISPIVDYTGNNWELQIGELLTDPPTISPFYALEKGLTYSIPTRIKVRLTNKQTGATKDDVLFFLNLPSMTEEGTFIINGIKRGIINQMVRAPGIYFTGEQDPATGKMLYHAEIRPVRGSWLEFFVGRKDAVFARIDRRRKFPATILLRAVNHMDDDQLVKEFHNFIIPTIEADPTKGFEEALLEFYRKLRPGEPVVLENAQKLLKDRFFDLKTYELGRIGRYKINEKFAGKLDDSDPATWVLQPEDITNTMKHLVALQEGEISDIDDIDHLGNRRLRQVGEIVAQVALRPALARFERMVKERMSFLSPKENYSAMQVFNPQPFISALNTFYRSNQLSTILDQTNPLAELDLLRRVTVVGPDGLTRERASFSIRDVHSSQYGRICPIRSPEGPNIGLVSYLSLFAQVNDYGFLETPYRKVVRKGKNAIVTDDVTYLSASEEAGYHITHLGIEVNAKNEIVDKWIPYRFKNEFVEGSVSQADYIDLVPHQAIGASASLIPFLSHDDATRALMGSHMQCQAAPLVNPERPLVGTGIEGAIATALFRSLKANLPGTVVSISGDEVLVELDKKVNSSNYHSPHESISLSEDEKHEKYHIFKFQRTSPYGTSYNQKIRVSLGEKVKAGDLIADGPSSDEGELALGRNLLVAYASIDGLGYEDSILISDRLVREDVFTSIQIAEYEAQVVETKLGPEELTRDIPNVSETDLARLDETGVVTIGAVVEPNDILVGKVEPKGEKELSAEERLLRAIFGEKARDVKDTSLRVPHGEGGVVIGISILAKDAGDELDPGVNKVVKVYVAQNRQIQEGDKLAGRHGNKGIVSRILPSFDMPHLADGTPVDIVISPLSVISRMNLGQIMEALLGWAGKKQNKYYAVPVFQYYSEERIAQELINADLPKDGKVILYDGRTGQPYDQKVMVGCAYILKLIHMVDDKVHARSTGPYSLVTQQPLGGKARMGGQRLGEMEVWALEAHRAAHTLQEMLTLKSDDVEGRAKAFQAIIKDQPIPTPTIPESFRVLVKELAGLSIKVSPVEAVIASQEEEVGDTPENKADLPSQESEEITVNQVETKDQLEEKIND